MSILAVEELTKHYPGVTAVKGVSFALEKGDLFGFLGPNGAGKTTTINMLTGLAHVSAGRVLYFGSDCTGRLKKVQARLGIVPDDSNLYDEYDGFDNLCFCAALYGVPRAEREERARDLLHRFGLDTAGKRLFKHYSKGMKRKLTIAAGIIHNPDILFLDEPTTGIDVASARQIRELIQTLNQQGTTIFLTTHYIEEAERLCRTIAFIKDGRILRVGRVADLIQEVQQERRVRFALQAPMPAEEIVKRLRPLFPDYRFHPGRDQSLTVTSAAAVDLVPFLQFFQQNGIMVYEAKRIVPSLEEVFVQVTGIAADVMKREKERRK